MATRTTRPLLRRILGRLPFGEALIRRLPRNQPYPLPRYTPGTPKIAGSGPLDVHLPLNPSTLGAAALQATENVAEVLQNLTQVEAIERAQAFYREGQQKFGEQWRYADILTVLWSAATLGRPVSYLEIGVRTGRSAAVVGAAAPECAVYGFDLWTPNYADDENPGPEFVRGELRKAGHSADVTLVSGNSRETLPAFLRKHPDLYFDIIVIDGDKSVPVAGSDYAGALPRLKVGGIIVSDDLFIVPHLRPVWVELIGRDRRFQTWQFADAGHGVAVGFRIADTPVMPGEFVPQS